MCSIGEDDFGDEGGLHSMEKDTKIKEPNKTFGKCSKCSFEGNLYRLKFRQPECSDCFLSSTHHKFRATLGSSKILPRGAEVLLIFDGSAGSMVLLDMVNFARKQNRFRRLHLEIKILYIDDSPLNGSINISAVSKFLLQYEFESYVISLTKENSLRKLVESDVFELDCIKSDLPINIKTLTSHHDFLKIIRKKVIEKAAKQLDCIFVFLPDISTNLATELINSVVLGRGGSAALDVSLLDDRLPGLKLLRPLRNLNASEVEQYLVLKDIKPLKTALYDESCSHNDCIQNLTRYFVDDLDVNFSSTISTVFRTGDKIAPNVLNVHNFLKEEPKCIFCKSQLNNLPSKTLQALEFSRQASAFCGNMDQCKAKIEFPSSKFLRQLCHACANIQNDFENGFLPR